MPPSSGRADRNRAFSGRRLAQASFFWTPINVDLTTISDYMVMLVFLLRSLGFSKTECRQLVRGYGHAIERMTG